ncbi:MAG: tyrosine-type recombinase/integrase [Terracidiphilus sp.]
MKRLSYQHGSVARVKRSTGPDAWVLRYYEYDLAGNRTQRATTFSDTRECPSKAQAERKAETLRQQINSRRACVYFENLADRYVKDGVPLRHSTRGPILQRVERLLDRWTGTRIDWMCEHPLDIQRWILSVKGKRGGDLAFGTRRAYKALLHRMFECAMMWGLLDMQRNPISFVELRGIPRSQRHTRTKTVLTMEQYGALLKVETLPPAVRVMIQLAAMTGLRASEFLGLRWDDIDFGSKLLSIHRSVVGRFEDETKTAASEAEIPMHPSLATLLRKWRSEQQPINGWVFGSIQTGRPFYRDGLRRNYLIPAGNAAGIVGIGWHTFRHTYRALLAELELPLEVQQHLMRHANIRTTMSYGQGAPGRAAKLRKANARVVALIEKQKLG